MLVKTVTMDQDLPASFPDQIKPENELGSIMDTLYKENPEYWPQGLNTNLFNGVGDRLFLIADNKNNRGAGFVGLQPFRPNTKTNGMATYISVGLLPEYRGKGLASKYLFDIVKKNIKPDEQVVWTANKNNDSSLSLYGRLLRSNLIKKLDLQVS